MEKTGIELITEKRQRQIDKHGHTIKSDVENNNEGQLAVGAYHLQETTGSRFLTIPKGWDSVVWDKMLNEYYKERLIMAGALIAAEIDRLNYEHD